MYVLATLINNYLLIMNVLALSTSSEYLCYGCTATVNSLSVGTDFRRPNIDVRFIV